MKTIEELIGNEATERLRERYGELVRWIWVEEQGPQVFKMELQVIDWKKMSPNPTDIDKEGALGVGIAEIEYGLYNILDFGDVSGDRRVHLNNNLPKNGIHMHPAIYAELVGSERESMRRIEGRLEHNSRGC